MAGNTCEGYLVGAKTCSLVYRQLYIRKNIYMQSYEITFTGSCTYVKLFAGSDTPPW